MQAKIFKIIACNNKPIEQDWRAQLVILLGSKPRRLSSWCELGLFGALSCIKKTGTMRLSSDIAIRVYSESGTFNATRMAMEQAIEHLPMPFTFMQTQPGQLFNALGTALAWHGDGYTTSCNNRQQSDSALLRGIKHAALLAWVDEEPEPVSRWIWLKKAEIETDIETDIDIEHDWQSVDSIFYLSDDALWLKIDAENGIFFAN